MGGETQTVDPRTGFFIEIPPMRLHNMVGRGHLSPTGVSLGRACCSKLCMMNCKINGLRSFLQKTVWGGRIARSAILKRHGHELLLGRHHDC